MLRTKFSVFLIVWVTTIIPEAQMDQFYCPNSINCTGGLQNEQIPIQTQICSVLLSLLLASRSACEGPFGSALLLTVYSGFDAYGILTGNDNLCDYFQPNTTVNNCLNPNGTIEANYCNSLFVLAYQLRNNCSDLYTFNGCELSSYAQATLDRLYSINNSCLITPYMSDCILQPRSQPPEKCPNCKVQPCATSQ